MRRPPSFAAWGVPLLACLALAQPARAIIILGDPGQNLSPAPDGLDRYVGDFGSYLGTPIGPRHFVTARHIGNAGGGVFEFTNGTGALQTFQVVQDPVSIDQADVLGDVAVWKIADDAAPGFDVFAPLYTAGDEVGRDLVLIGRGVSRGAAFQNALGADVGWHWGADDDQRSWGTNQVHSIINGPFTYGGVDFSAPTPPGDFLRFDFDLDGGPNEGIYGSSDSGGPAFALDPADGVWKLAGIANAVLTGFSTTAGGPYEAAALFDVRDLYYGNPTNQVLLSGTEPLGAYSLASRIGSPDRLAILGQFTPIPEPGSLVLLGVGLIGAWAASRRQTAAAETRQ